MKNTLTLLWNLLPYILILALLSSLFVTCENKKTHANTIEALNSKIKTYALKNGQLVASQATIYYDNNQLKSELQKSKQDALLAKEFYKVRTVLKIVNSTVVDTIVIRYKDSVPCVFFKKIDIATKEYSLIGTSTQKGIVIHNLTIPDTLTIISGTKRKWFLGKQTTTTDVIHTNKLVKTTEIKHIELKEKKRFYETTLFKVGIGIFTGIIITK